ncbi:hypothetical protein [Aerococcus urinae]|uniref:Uncharacterized protein n=1 Tax=Aerococcus urinae TaxID=1376 RepID=A0A0X8FFH9_9LACT|nr:hypothetical protein [Aerococcus urinae]AMB95557.1 hypothetical protein AWM73_03005 [Aerococcus urinae]MCY3032579.1 hypothetical protein [Aerococcus urinae]MCY3037880.1 hypothetical protein [Aerococcus urinae]MCY3044625.1 hypothetical protein [Aerococcus urinae]MCY3045762.1 hypothetical protein [Aerococcus urinae]
MTKDEIKEVRVQATLATAGIRIDEAKTLINIIKRKAYVKAFNVEDLAEWGEDEIAEYAFECAEEMTRLQSLAETLDESIIETNYSLKELDKLLFGGSEESEDEAPADLKEAEED